MRLCKSQTQSKILDVKSHTGRKTREETTLIGGHVGSCLVIIPETGIKIFVKGKLTRKHEMPEKI